MSLALNRTAVNGRGRLEHRVSAPASLLLTAAILHSLQEMRSNVSDSGTRHKETETEEEGR